MTAASRIAATSWENKFFAFLREELAPSPTRWRAALRITLLCALGTAFVMALHVPDGEFVIIFFFAVSQPDAWASFRRARLRGIGTLVGGGLSILTILTCGDKPWLFFSIQAVLFAAGLFLSITTTIQYAVIIALFTFVIATPFEDVNPETALRTALWRILLTWVAVVFGTIGQLVLWPEKPEKLLRDELAAQLAGAEAILDRLLNRREDSVLPASARVANISAVVASQLDLLASAEAGNPLLRQHHAQQVKLITDIELIFGMVARLENLVQLQPAPILPTGQTRIRLQNIQNELPRLQRALKQGKPLTPTVDEPAGSPVETGPDENENLPWSLVLQKIERCLRQMPASMALLEIQETDSAAGGSGLDRIFEPLGWGTVLTPACSLSNITALQFSLKGALAGSLCYVFYQALDWPGISTCVVTALIVTQSSFGASIQKSVLRLVGAALGGLMAFAIITLIIPNMETVASVVVVTSIPFFVAAWIVTGSTKISYVGMQTGLVLALVLLNRLGPTTDLAPAGDRLLGVFIGIVVMGFINLALWPNFAGKALRKKLTDALRALAAIVRHPDDLVVGNAHREIAAALTLYNDSLHEFGSQAAATEADRQKSLAVISRLQEVFLALLVIIRRRAILNQFAVPTAWQRPLQTLDEVIVQRLERLADSPAKSIATDLPGFGQAFTDLQNVLAEPAAQVEADAILTHKLTELAAAYVELVEPFEQLQADLTRAGATHV